MRFHIGSGRQQSISSHVGALACVVCALAILACVGGCNSQHITRLYGQWTMFRESNGRTSYTPEAVRLPLTQQWSVRTGENPLNGQLVVMLNEIVSASGKTVACHDRNNGSTIWSYAVNGWAFQPSITEGRVVFGVGSKPRTSSRGSVTILDLVNGKLLFDCPLTNAIDWSNSGYCVKNGQIFVVEDAGLIDVIDLRDGKKKRTYQPVPGNNHFVGVPVVQSNTMFVAVGSETVEATSPRATKSIYALNIDTGNVLWNKDYEVSVLPACANENGVFIIPGYFHEQAEKGIGFIEYLDAVTGERQWSFNLGSDLWLHLGVAFNPSSNSLFYGYVIFNHEDVSADRDMGLGLLDASTGQPIWKKRPELPHGWLVEPIVTGSIGWIVYRPIIKKLGEGWEVIGVDLRNGDIVSRTASRGLVGVISCDGFLYSISTSGNVSSFK